MRSGGEGELASLVTGDLVDHGVEFGARECPLEWLGDVAVVLAEVHQVPGEFGERCQVVGRVRALRARSRSRARSG